MWVKCFFSELLSRMMIVQSCVGRLWRKKHRTKNVCICLKRLFRSSITGSFETLWL
ncbi:hypothetical protein Plhal304r1_c042g0122311 [Plasmopara halstedii]